MKTIDSLYKILFEKLNVLILSVLMLIISAHRPIEMFFSSTIVKYVLKDIDSNLCNDCFFIVALLLTLTLVIHRFKKYIPSKSIVGTLLLLSLIYSYYRFGDFVWEFRGLSFYPIIKYSDILIIVTISNLILLIPKDKESKESKENNEESFMNDEPLGSEGLDAFGYEKYAESLSIKIMNSHFENSFAIGINGKWGAGKTSFIDLIKRNIDKEKVIEINFNPWHSDSPKAIVKDFFETVQLSLRSYHSSLSRTLINYSDKMVSLNDNTVTQTIQATVNTITGFKSLNDLFKDINNSLKEIDKKIIIYIDDLDRLDKQEIIEVIRLVRNTANFYNTFFVVAYDRNYVVNALEDHNKYRNEHFLEKIFQIEITLPYFKKHILRYNLAEKINSKIPQDYHNLIEKNVLGPKYYFKNELDEWLENMRDVTRLANSVILNLKQINGEIDFKDFIYIELIRMKYPSVYELLSKKESEFFKTEKNNKGKYQYELIEEDNEDKVKVKEIKLKTYLKKNFINHSIPQEDISKTIDLLCVIFKNNKNYYGERSHLSIIYPSKFQRYFTYNLLEGSLSEIEFSKARSSDQSTFNSKISEWIEKGLENELKERLEEIKTFDDRIDFEKVITSIFYFGNHKNNLGEYCQYDLENLFTKLSNYEGVLFKKYYDGLNDTELESFIENIFQKAKSPYLFETRFIEYSLSHQHYEIPISTEKLSSIATEYLRAYCQEEKIDYVDVWRIFRSCRLVTIKENQRDFSISEEVKTIMKDFALAKDLNGFLKSIIYSETNDYENFTIIYFVKMIFDTWENFIEYIGTQSEEKNDYLIEFKKFLEVLSKEKFESHVPFKFNIIPIQN